MVLGWVLSCIVFTAIILLDLSTHTKDKLFTDSTSSSVSSTAKRTSPHPITYLVLSLIAGIAIQISWMAAVIASVEYAQREHIHYRGRLQATLLCLYYFGGCCARTLIAFIISQSISSGMRISTISLGHAATILAVVSLVAIPFVVYCFDEEPVSQSKATTMALGERLARFWKFCHHNVVYRVLFFIGLHLFLLGIYNQNVRDAVQKWSHVSKQDSLFVEAGRLATQILSTLFWKAYLRNVSWRMLSLWGPALYVVLYTVLSLCAANDVVRSVWFYGIIVSLADIPRAWILLYALILATEIAEIGHEGVTVTLGMSFKGLAGLADYTLAAIFPNVFGFKVSVAQVQADNAATRHNVTIALLISIAFNLLSFALIALPPRQKLDAQQMRAFGGYNRLAGWALLFTFAVFISFNLTANLVVVL